MTRTKRMEEKVIVTFDFEMDDEICGKICDKLTKIQTSIYIFDCFVDVHVLYMNLVLFSINQIT